MPDIQITLPDGCVRTFPKGVTLKAVAEAIGPRLARDAVAAKVDQEVRDLSRSLESNARVEILTPRSPEGLEVYRHSSSHLLAYAVKEVFEDVKVAIGPVIEDGFYYDFDTPHAICPEDFEAIEKKMQELIDQDLPFERKVLPQEEAIALFERQGEKYKKEIVEGLSGETITAYQVGDFIDLCRGPHVPSSGKIKAFKLLGVAGAYWRGSEKNPMLQRVYGTSWSKKEELAAYLHRLEEAKRRDHRRLGRELDLFSISEDIGAGLILWHPKGARVRNIIEDHWRREHYRHGYDLVASPHVAKYELWKRTGHASFYRENMYSPMDVDEVKYLVKPMNCPFHATIFKSRTRSYRDLPLRWAELGTVYRYERSGVLHGLLRVRGFTQDDAHLFCRPEQLEGEIADVLRFVFTILRTFGFTEYEVYLSTRPEKFVGTHESWEHATGALEAALKRLRVEFQIDPGEGVFYGPKIDIKIKDSLGRSWQCSTVQVDFNNPERLDLKYVGADGAHHRPIMVHRALLGSIERFFGILIEHHAGAFPMWLAPVQVRVLPLSEKFETYAREVHARLTEGDVRSELDDRNEKLGFRIREAEVEKIPLMLILGEREAQARTVTYRERGHGAQATTDVEGLMRIIQEREVQRT
ncbi:MAG: threonine--tRNA ligase [Deltaproteobacteria bacterium RBG_13_65_10]|nr:MAG: threonine--tRNA ligase [Deltaproteobacteria bacterium RBG_13_65_10]